MPTPAELVGGIVAADQLEPLDCRRHAASRFDTGRMAASYTQLYDRALTEWRHRVSQRIEPHDHPRPVVPAAS